MNDLRERVPSHYVLYNLTSKVTSLLLNSVGLTDQPQYKRGVTPRHEYQETGITCGNLHI